MATWELSALNKKSVVEKQYFFKNKKLITMESGYRWGTFRIVSDERPLTDEDLNNEDGYELGCIDNDQCWEMHFLDDGCWTETEAGNPDTTEEDLAEFEAAFSEDYFQGVEEAGWSNDDAEYWFYGPLSLVNLDTGEKFLGQESEE